MLFHVGLGEARYRELGTYSVGMKQMAKLAQAIVHLPELVILDEPTNGLDPAARSRMLELVREIKGYGMGVLLCSHLLRDVEEVCDEVIIMIVLDCPPSLGFLPINALLASSDLVIPLNPEEFGLKAIKDISKTVAKCKDNLGHTVRLLGVLITRMRAQTTLHQTYADEIRRSFGPKVFETSIREAVVVGESVTHRRPLIDYAPRHVVTEEFCAVTEELLRRVQASKTTGARRRLRAG